MQNQDYDLIIIGSGMGALSLASIMARAWGRKALILEQHTVIGGYTHTFKRKGKFEWDVGLHYVGDMGRGDQGRAIFDYITDRKLEWNRMPDPFDVFSYPDFTFEHRVGKHAAETDMIRMFPAEKRAIRQYFRDIKRAARWSAARLMAGVLPGAAGRAAELAGITDRRFALTPMSEYLHRNFKDHKLRALLLSQWGDHGLMPSQCPFVMHALITAHYLTGAYYPVGGSSRIAACIMPVVERAGGRFVTKRRVTQIIVKKGKAIGVKTQHTQGGQLVEQEHFAPVIVSNAGQYNTFAHLVPPEYSGAYAAEPKRFAYGMSTACLFLGLKQSPATLGFKGENHWIYSSYNHEDNYLNNHAKDGKPASCYMSFPSLKDPAATAHTAEILTFVPYEDFKEWETTTWRRRGADYEAMKERMAAGLLDFVETRHPGFKDLIEFQELSTPLSNVHFCAHPMGGIFGIPATPERLRNAPVRATTPIRNLFLTGADTFLCGIIPAAVSGAITAGAIHGPLGFFKVMAKIFKQSSRA